MRLSPGRCSLLFPLLFREVGGLQRGDVGLNSRQNPIPGESKRTPDI